jgi:hypothetical protein
VKKIINGVRYDTDKAELIGEYETNLPYNDFKWFSAGLYVTPKARRYFLVGEGGPMTRFAQRVDNGATYGEGLFPMEPSEAREWAEQHLSVETVEQHFADQIEDA